MTATQSPKVLAGVRLAAELRRLADAAERAGRGDESALLDLQYEMDWYWHALSIGREELAILMEHGR